MCKDCENNINKNEELEQENVSLEDLSKDELLDVCYELINQKEKQIDVDFHELDIDRFDEGVAIASKYIGIYSALRSSGFAEADAYEMTINQQNIDFQKTVNAPAIALYCFIPFLNSFLSIVIPSKLSTLISISLSFCSNKE